MDRKINLPRTLTTRFSQFRKLPVAAMLCLAMLITPPAHAGEPDGEAAKPGKAKLLEILPRQERIKIDMVRDRRNRGQSSSRDRLDRIKFTVKLTNQETTKEFPELKGIFVVIAQNLVEKKRYVALLKQEFDVKLGKGTTDREMEWESDECATSFYDGYGYKSGEAYDGWVFALVNEENQIVAYKASKETYAQNVAKIGSIRKKSWFDIQLDPVDAAYMSNRYLNY